MLDVLVQSLGDPGTFDITDKSDPQYYIARYAHEMSLNLYWLKFYGFKWYQEEDSDYTTLQTSYETYASDMWTWFVTAVDQAESGSPISVPPAIPALPGNTLPGMLLSIFLRVAVQLTVYWLHKKLDPATDAKEICRILRQAFIGEVDSTEYPLIELLANIPLEIIFSRAGEYQDFFYTDRPET